MVAGAKTNNYNIDTCSSREMVDRTIIGDLLVKYGGGVKVYLFEGWARGVVSRATRALLAQESNRCRYKTRNVIIWIVVVTYLFLATTSSLGNIMAL